MEAKVDFPEPLGPTRATISPFRATIVTLETAAISDPSYVNVTCSRTTSRGPRAATLASHEINPLLLTVPLPMRRTPTAPHRGERR